ncbi:MAG: class F sortase [bacterium]|nr:class F sortase [bacterium]
MSGYTPYEEKPRQGGQRTLIFLLIVFSALFVRSVASEIMKTQPRILPTASVNSVYAATTLNYPTPSAPVRLRIPAINVDANIQSLGKNAKGEMDTPHGENRYQEAGWFNLGPKPGEIGSAVMAGHVDTYSLLTPGIFHDIDKLIPGDIVEVIDSNGTLFRFKVTGSAEFSAGADASSVFGSTGKARLNLITCAGDWQQDQRQFNKRLVVFTELVE